MCINVRSLNLCFVWEHLNINRLKEDADLSQEHELSGIVANSFKRV